MLKNELLKGGLVALTGTYIASQFFPIEVSGMISSITSNTIFLAGIGSCALGSFGLWLQTKDSVEKIIHQVFKHTGPAIQVGKTYLYPRLVQKKRMDYGWHLVYGLPNGISDIDIFKKHRDLEIATNSEIEMWEEDGKMHLHLYCHKLERLVEWKDIPDGIKSFSRVPEFCFVAGKSKAGYEVLDLIDTQHILVAGEAGGGKTNLLRLIALYLTHNPNIRLFIIDVKRNLGFLRDYSWFACKQKEVQKMVDYLAEEMDRRYDIFDKMGVDDVRDLPSDLAKKYPRLVLIIDEFSGISPDLAQGEDKKERKSTIDKLVDLINRGRGCGCYVILGTQRPDANLMSSGQIKANMSVRFAFRVTDSSNSKVILDSIIAALLPANIPGRCFLRGRDRTRQVQVINMPLSLTKTLLPEKPMTCPEIINRKVRNDGAC